MTRDARTKRPVGQARIRRYRTTDNESCRSLWTELTLWHRRIYLDGTIGGSDPGSHFDVHLRKHGKGDIWVAEVDGMIAGMAGLVMGDEGPELEPLIVGARYRGKGIGALLVKAVIQAARKRGATMLSVKPVMRNDLAIRFFRDLGFDTLGHIELFMDFTPSGRQKWKGRKTVAGRNFRY